VLLNLPAITDQASFEGTNQQFPRFKSSGQLYRDDVCERFARTKWGIAAWLALRCKLVSICGLTGCMIVSGVHCLLLDTPGCSVVAPMRPWLGLLVRDCRCLDALLCFAGQDKGTMKFK
jgi:hypothetical protein